MNKELGEIINKDKLILALDKRNWEYTFKELGVEVDIEKSIKSAYKRGKEGNILNKIKLYIFLYKNGEDIPLQVDINNNQLRRVIDELAIEIREEPVNGKIEYKEGSFIITPERKGISLDKEATEKLIIEGIKSFSKESIIMPIRYRAQG